MKFKKIVILLLFVLISFITIKNVSYEKFEYGESNIIIYEDELNDKNVNAAYALKDDRVNWSGGAFVGGSIGGGGLLLYGIWYISTEISKWINSLPSNNNYSVDVNNLTIDDVLNYPDIKEGMEKYGWTRERLINWLETMMGDISVTHFLNDEENVIYLGSTKDTNDYSVNRDTDNHKYAFHVEKDVWKDLFLECNENYGMIWVLNMTFLQMAIMKNAKIILVTPTLNFYDYLEKKARVFKDENGKDYYPFYGLELEYINDRGYFWDNQESAFVETYRN